MGPRDDLATRQSSLTACLKRCDPSEALEEVAPLHSEQLAKACLKRCDASEALEEMASQHHSEQLAEACLERCDACALAKASGVCD